jgi:hypothetical protein
VELATFGWVFAATAAVFLLVGTVIVHLIEWHLYVDARALSERLQRELAAASRERDGWRDVAERALVVAQIGKRVTTHAAIVTRRAANVIDPT